MKASKLIEKLNKLIEEQGDLHVYTDAEWGEIISISKKFERDQNDNVFYINAERLR